MTQNEKEIIAGCRKCKTFKSYDKTKALPIDCCLGEIHIKTAMACNRNKNNKWKSKVKKPAIVLAGVVSEEEYFRAI